MSDTLTVSATTAVVTDELLEHAAQLGGLSGRAEGWVSRLHMLARDNADEWVAEPASTAQLLEAQRHAQQLSEESERLRAALAGAAEAYGHAERTIARLWGVGAQIGAWLTGAVLPVATFLAVPAAAAAALAATRLGALFGLPPQKIAGMVSEWVQSNPSLLNSPAFVNAVRALASNSDEFAMGMAGIPLAVTVGLGSHLKAEQSAVAITTIGALVGIASGTRSLQETAQRVTPASTAKPVTPPQGVAGLAHRVMSPAAGDPQIRIERYGSDEAPKWVAYISGTVDFTMTPGRESFDSTSNLHAAADGVAASERAVREALSAAGAAPSDELLLVGHSQGGLIAARLAESHDLNVTAFMSMGGPLGSVSTGEVPGLSIEHSDDLVPAVAGAGEEQTGLITVSRTVLDNWDAAAAASGAKPAEPFAAHALTHYRETAVLVGSSPNERLSDFNQTVNDFVGSDEGTRTQWRSERVLPKEGG